MARKKKTSERTALWHRKHEIGSFWMRCADWPLEAVGAYLWVLDHVFQQGPLSRAAIDRKLSNLRDPDSAALIMERLVEVEGGWTHERAHKERVHALGVSRVRSSVGALGGKKSRKSLNGKDLEAKQTDSNCLPIAEQLPSKPSISLSLSSSDSSSSSKTRENTKTVEEPRWNFNTREWEGITDEFVASVEAKCPGFDVRGKIEELADYLRMKPKKARTYSDFAAMIRNCCRNDWKNAPSQTRTVSRHRETTAEKNDRLNADIAAQMARVAADQQSGGFAATLRPEGSGRVQTHPNNRTQQRAS